MKTHARKTMMIRDALADGEPHSAKDIADYCQEHRYRHTLSPKEIVSLIHTSGCAVEVGEVTIRYPFANLTAPTYKII
jgi:hypothetical protein